MTMSTYCNPDVEQFSCPLLKKGKKTLTIRTKSLKYLYINTVKKGSLWVVGT